MNEECVGTAPDWEDLQSGVTGYDRFVNGKIKVMVSETGIFILDLNSCYLHLIFISLFQAHLQRWHMRNGPVGMEQNFY